MSPSKTFALILVACLAVGGDCIQCYVCDDCDVLDECLLQSCPKIGTTTTLATPSTSKIPPIGTGTTTIGTTVTGTTVPSTTVPSTTVPSTTVPSTTVPSTTVPSTTVPSTTVPSTTVPSTTVNGTTVPGTTRTSTLPSTTTSDGSPSTTEESSGTTDESTSTPTIYTESTTEPSTSASTAKLERISSSKFSPDYKSVLMRAATTHHCYSIEIVENNKRKMRRGCVEVAYDDNACDVLIDKHGCTSRKCRVCSESRCNSSDALVFPYKTWITVYMVFLIFQ